MHTTEPPNQKTPRLALSGWLVAALLVFLLGLILPLFDDTTELTPRHDNVVSACFVITALGALVIVGLAIRKSRMPIARRILFSLLCGIVAFITGFRVIGVAAEMIEGLIDFPSGKTRSYQSLLTISRAYRVRGKSQNWHIQTMPLWSDLNIAKSDYDLMHAQRRPGDEGRDPDEISSEGYFCAKVTLEQSGNVLRIMHAGTRELPEGTVIVCPSFAR